MRKKMLFFHLAYYILVLLIYVGFLYGSVKLFDTSNLGAVIVLVYGLLFAATPILIAVLMRFSLLKWYVDPFAAAEVPLFFYFGMIINQMNRLEVDFYGAFLKINEKLSTNGGEGWFFLVGLFLFGIAVSFSFDRMKEESISYKLISKIVA